MYELVAKRYKKELNGAVSVAHLAGSVMMHYYDLDYAVSKKDDESTPEASIFTDDTVLTVAVADVILTGRPYQLSVREIGRRYPGAGYGGSFIGWLYSDHPQPYNSRGNWS
jgi:hypothetical protein